MDDPQLMEVLRSVAQEAEKEIQVLIDQGSDMCKELCPLHIDPAVAHVLLKLLPVGSSAPWPSIQEQPLVTKDTWRKTVDSFTYVNVPLLPDSAVQCYRNNGERPPTEWGPMRELSWASKPSLLDEAADGPGIYQIFLCRYEVIGGRRTLVLQTEWYLGEAAGLWPPHIWHIWHQYVGESADSAHLYRVIQPVQAG